MTHPSDAELSELLTLAEKIPPLKTALDAIRFSDVGWTSNEHAVAFSAWRDARNQYERAVEPDVLAPLIREILERRKADALTTEQVTALVAAGSDPLPYVATYTTASGDDRPEPLDPDNGPPFTNADAAKLGRDIANLATINKLAAFGAWAVQSTFGDLGIGSDIDGDEAQDEAIGLGLVVVTNVSEPCRDGCFCAETNNIPGDCYRYSPDVAAYLVALPEDTTPNE